MSGWTRPLRVRQLPMLAVIFVFICTPLAGAQQTVSRPLPQECALQMQSSGAHGVLRIAVLGDSIAQGWGTTQPDACSFPSQIAALAPLQVTKAVDIQMSVTAIGGKRADEMEPYATDLANQDPDIAIIELGTNDERESWPPDQTQATLMQIISIFAQATSARFGHPRLLCLGVWPSPQFEAPAQMEPYEEAIQAACSAYGGSVVDLTSLATVPGVTTLESNGNWHPDDYGAQLIGSEIIQALITSGAFSSWCHNPQECQPMPVVAPPAGSPPSIVPPSKRPVRNGLPVVQAP